MGSGAVGLSIKTCSVALTTAVIVNLITSTTGSQRLCNTASSILIILNSRIFASIFSVSLVEKFIHELAQAGYLLRCLCLGTALHSITYLSSSFIEEEHQIWNYFSYSAYIAFCLVETRRSLQRSSRDRVPRSCLTWIIFFVSHLVARRLNQTGDKWLTEWDIGDWLTLESNLVYNSVFVGLSLALLVTVTSDFGGILTNILTLTACILIFYFRALSGSIVFIGIRKSEPVEMCLFLLAVNIAEIIAINGVPIIFNLVSGRLKSFDVKLALGTSIVVFALLSALTHKPHNIFLVPVMILTSQTINRCATGLHKAQHSVYIRAILHYWMGRQFFFYQGNSNSLASIDLNAGYIGLKSFNFVFVGVFLTINTFSGPLLSSLLLAYSLYDCKRRNIHSEKPQMTISRKMNAFDAGKMFIFILFLLPFAVYTLCALAFRNHIFVWTVFSPKLLYEFYSLCLMCTIWMGLNIIPVAKTCKSMLV